MNGNFRNVLINVFKAFAGLVAVLAMCCNALDGASDRR